MMIDMPLKYRIFLNNFFHETRTILFETATLIELLVALGPTTWIHWFLFKNYLKRHLQIHYQWMIKGLSISLSTLMYNGLISTIPFVWRKSLLILNNTNYIISK